MNPDEQPGGHSLSTAPAANPAGAFAYQMADGTLIFYLIRVGDEQVRASVSVRGEREGVRLGLGMGDRITITIRTVSSSSS